MYPYTLVGTTKDGNDSILVFKPPWNQLDAITFNTKKVQLKEFPIKNWKNFDLQQLDTYVAYFYNFLQDSKQYEQTEVTYPSQTRITVHDLRPGYTALLFTNYDLTWHLTQPMEGMTISEQGPSLISITNNTGTVQTITIEHGMAKSDEVALALIPTGLALFFIYKIWEHFKVKANN